MGNGGARGLNFFNDPKMAPRLKFCMGEMEGDMMKLDSMVYHLEGGNESTIMALRIYSLE